MVESTITVREGTNFPAIFLCAGSLGIPGMKIRLLPVAAASYAASPARQKRHEMAQLQQTYSDGSGHFHHAWVAQRAMGTVLQ